MQIVLLFLDDFGRHWTLSFWHSAAQRAAVGGCGPNQSDLAENEIRLRRQCQHCNSPTSLCRLSGANFYCWRYAGRVDVVPPHPDNTDDQH